MPPLTFETPGSVSASVELAVGDVRIDADDHGTVLVEVQPSDPANANDVEVAEQTRVAFADGVLRVRGPKLRSWLSRGDGGSVDVRITLPTGSNVDAHGAAVDFACEGVLGDCRIKTGLGAVRLQGAASAQLKVGAGDVTVDRVAGRAEVTTGSGDVRVGELGPDAVIKNSNGATWIGTTAHGMRVNAANGDVVVGLATGDMTAKSANGDVRLGEAVRGSIVLETRLGDVEVGIRAGTAAWLDAHASAGRVTNALEPAEAPPTIAETVQVRARTSVGEILIRRP